MILIQGGAGQYRLSKTCAVHGTQPFLPPYSDFFELIMEALLRIKTQLISHPWKLTYQDLSVLFTDSPEHPFLLLSGCYKLSAFTGRLSKCCLENYFLIQLHQCAVMSQAVVLERLHQEPLCTMHSIHPTWPLSIEIIQDSLTCYKSDSPSQPASCLALLPKSSGYFEVQTNMQLDRVWPNILPSSKG